MDLFGLQGHPRMFRYHLIRIRIWIREIRFFEIRTFCFFDFLSLKTLQYGCLMTPLDHLMDPNVINQMLFAYCSFKFTFKQILGAMIYT